MLKLISSKSEGGIEVGSYSPTVDSSTGVIRATEFLGKVSEIKKVDFVVNSIADNVREIILQNKKYNLNLFNDLVIGGEMLAIGDTILLIGMSFIGIDNLFTDGETDSQRLRGIFKVVDIKEGDPEVERIDVNTPCIIYAETGDSYFGKKFYFLNEENKLVEQSISDGAYIKKDTLGGQLYFDLDYLSKDPSMNNIVIGNEATIDLEQITALSDCNIAIGHRALKLAKQEKKSIAIGYRALDGSSKEDGFGCSFNTALGYMAGTKNYTGSKNVYIGSMDNDGISNASAFATDFSETTCLGHNAYASKSNAVILGNPHNADIMVGIGTSSPDSKLHVVGDIRIEGDSGATATIKVPSSIVAVPSSPSGVVAVVVPYSTSNSTSNTIFTLPDVSGTLQLNNGSGNIITTEERDKLSAIDGSGNIITTEERNKLSAINSNGSWDITAGTITAGTITSKSPLLEMNEKGEVSKSLSVFKKAIFWTGYDREETRVPIVSGWVADIESGSIYRAGEWKNYYTDNSFNRFTVIGPRVPGHDTEFHAKCGARIWGDNFLSHEYFLSSGEKTSEKIFGLYFNRATWLSAKNDNYYMARPMVMSFTSTQRPTNLRGYNEDLVTKISSGNVDIYYVKEYIPPSCLQNKLNASNNYLNWQYPDKIGSTLLADFFDLRSVKEMELENVYNDSTEKKEWITKRDPSNNFRGIGIYDSDDTLGTNPTTTGDIYVNGEEVTTRNEFDKLSLANGEPADDVIGYVAEQPGTRGGRVLVSAINVDISNWHLGLSANPNNYMFHEILIVPHESGRRQEYESVLSMKHNITITKPDEVVSQHSIKNFNIDLEGNVSIGELTHNNNIYKNLTENSSNHIAAKLTINGNQTILNDTSFNVIPYWDNLIKLESANHKKSIEFYICNEDNYFPQAKIETSMGFSESQSGLNFYTSDLYSDFLYEGRKDERMSSTGNDFSIYNHCMTMSNKGFVGIGTTSPTTQLDVLGTITAGTITAGTLSSSTLPLFHNTGTSLYENNNYSYGLQTDSYYEGKQAFIVINKPNDELVIWSDGRDKPQRFASWSLNPNYNEEYMKDPFKFESLWFRMAGWEDTMSNSFALPLRLYNSKIDLTPVVYNKIDIYYVKQYLKPEHIQEGYRGGTSVIDSIKNAQYASTGNSLFYADFFDSTKTNLVKIPGVKAGHYFHQTQVTTLENYIGRHGRSNLPGNTTDSGAKTFVNGFETTLLSDFDDRIYEDIALEKRKVISVIGADVSNWGDFCMSSNPDNFTWFEIIIVDHDESESTRMDYENYLRNKYATEDDPIPFPSGREEKNYTIDHHITSIQDGGNLDFQVSPLIKDPSNNPLGKKITYSYSDKMISEIEFAPVLNDDGNIDGCIKFFCGGDGQQQLPNYAMTMSNKGYININSGDISTYPLHVRQLASDSTETYTAYIDGKAYIRDELTVNGQVLGSSDKRIKKDIVDVPDNLSLQQVRDIPCRYYNYIDKTKSQHHRIGFIAQEVREVLPIAVTLRQDFIPNEMRFIENPQWTTITSASGNTKYKLTIHDLDDASGNTKHRFYLSNNPSGSDASGNDASGNDASGNDASGNDSSGNDASGNDASGNDASGNDASGNDASGNDASGNDASGNDASGNDASGNDASGNDASGNDASGNDVSGNDASGNDSSGNDVSGNDASGNDASGNDASEKDVVEKDTTERMKEIFSMENDPKSFIFEEKWDTVFLFGKQVDDFHGIDKNAIFALNFSATQEIDKIQQSEKIKLEEAETKLVAAETKISEQETKLVAAETKISEQETKLVAAETKISEQETNLGDLIAQLKANNTIS